MRARVASLSSRQQAAVAAIAIVVFALAVWFVGVAPKRAEAARLADEVAAAELRLSELKATARPERGNSAVVDVFRLAKAMPSSSDQAGLVLELDRLAHRSGLTLKSITVQDTVVTPGVPTTVPVIVTVGGTYRQVTRFLRSARELVSVRNGTLRATGRLFTVQSIDLVESKTAGFPQLESTIGLNAYVYDGPVVPAAPVTPTDTGTESASPATSAAGATP